MNFDKNLIKEPNEKLIYKTVGNLKLPMNVYYPITGINGKMPCVLCIHGGSWKTKVKENVDFTTDWMDMNAKYYACQGMVGIAISYRSIEDENTDVFDLISDCKDAMRFIKEKLDYVDNTKIVVIGDSAGGHLATWLGICEDDFLRPKITIACNPVLDLTKEIWHFCADTKEKLHQASPLFYDVKKASKFLCMHGDEDDLVAIEDTIEFSKKLNENGFSSEMITEKGKKHAFVLFDYESSDEDAVMYMEQTMEFIEKNL